MHKRWKLIVSIAEMAGPGLFSIRATNIQVSAYRCYQTEINENQWQKFQYYIINLKNNKKRHKHTQLQINTGVVLYMTTTSYYAIHCLLL